MGVFYLSVRENGIRNHFDLISHPPCLTLVVRETSSALLA
jgi:hypothetical protein